MEMGECWARGGRWMGKKRESGGKREVVAYFICFVFVCVCVYVCERGREIGRRKKM